MKVEKLLEIVESRGLKVRVSAGRPVLVGNPTEVTPVLMEAVKTHRRDILEHLGLAINETCKEAEEQQIECLWPGTQTVGRHWFPAHGWPVGAYYYRKVGAAEWQPIPGRVWDAGKKRGTVDHSLTQGVACDATAITSGVYRPMEA